MEQGLEGTGEADETCFWLELIIEGKAQPLLKKADELTAIFVSSIKTSQQNQKLGFKNHENP